MRKILSLLLCVAMLCSLVVITAQADGAATMQVANVTAVSNSAVTVDLNVVNNPGIASLKLTIVDTNGLGATFAGADNSSDSLALTTNDAAGVYSWIGPTNKVDALMGTLTITIPEGAENGDYVFTVTTGTGNFQAVNASGVKQNIASTTFTITVTDKAITGVNVAIDAGLAIGVHVQAATIEGVSITAVDVENKLFQTVEDYEEDEDGGYVFYLNVNPWAMDKEFYVDFTDNFVIDGDQLDMASIGGTAKPTGILRYCNAVLAGASDELKQLIADLLAYGQAAQTYQGVTVMDLPAGLTPTVGEWLDGEENSCDFGTFCSENYPMDIGGHTAAAKAKAKFSSATIEIGALFKATFTIGGTAPSAARVKTDAETVQVNSSNQYTYAFSAMEYAGIQFKLYATGTINNTNYAWDMNYGPAYYAAYVADSGEEGSAEILTVLEAFYLYGASVEAYVGSLGE